MLQIIKLVCLGRELTVAFILSTVSCYIRLWPYGFLIANKVAELFALLISECKVSEMHRISLILHNIKDI
jgi:hypothetical protein